MIEQPEHPFRTYLRSHKNRLAFENPKTMLRILLATIFLCLPLSAGQQDNRKVEGSTKEIFWGQHWAGPEVNTPADLKGKVTLLVIWGG